MKGPKAWRERVVLGASSFGFFACPITFFFFGLKKLLALSLSRTKKTHSPAEREDHGKGDRTATHDGVFLGKRGGEKKEGETRSLFALLFCVPSCKKEKEKLVRERVENQPAL